MSVWEDANIVWADVETNGLDPYKNRLLQIAVIVTDKNLNILDEKGFEATVYYDPSTADDLRYQAIQYVRDMHEKTGLWAKLSGTDALPISQIDTNLLKYVSQFGKPEMMPVAGNSVRLDMNFMDEYLPFTASYLDYHMRDVSTIAGFAQGWYGQPNFEKNNDHTAMTDIRESIREMQHYRDTVFRPVVVRQPNLEPVDPIDALEAIDAMLNPGYGVVGEAETSISRNMIARVLSAIPAAVVSETEVVELTHEQAEVMEQAFWDEKRRIRHEAEPWVSEAKRDTQKRIANIQKAVELGVPLEQVERFVFGKERS